LKRVEPTTRNEVGGLACARRRRKKLAETLGLADAVRSIPIVDPVVNYSIGMVIPQRDPMTPLIAALVQVAREVAPTLQSE
jgi:hypothetical protein